MNLREERILSTISRDDFLGRSRELERVLSHARGESKVAGLLVLAGPALGASELLRQSFDRLFSARGEAVPFYFALKRADKSPQTAALRFVTEFIQQIVAFRRRDRKILDSPMDVDELVRLAPPGDAIWLEHLAERCRLEGDRGDGRSLVRACLSAPLRAATVGTRVFAMIDDLHEVEHLAGETDLVDELNDIFLRSSTPFVFAGRRRFLTEKTSEDFEQLEVERLSFADAGALAENLAARYEIKINHQTRDLLAVQLSGNPFFIKLLLKAAGERKIDLGSFRQLERLYAEEIFGGRLARFFDGVFAEAVPGTETQRQVFSLLHDELRFESEKTHLEVWQTRTKLADEAFSRLVRLLNIHEIVSLKSNLIEPERDNTVLQDYVAARFQLEIAGQNHALALGETISGLIKRAPKLLADFYRGKSAVGLRDVLALFDCQEVPLALLDYSRFRDELKGASAEEVSAALGESPETIKLPQIVFTAHTTDFHPPFGRTLEKERSAVALGFIECSYTEDDETAWLAAEIDSKLEASREAAEEWCARLEEVAEACQFRSYRIWLVAPEGFSPAAAEVLRTRNAFGSSRRQVEMLVERLGAREPAGEKLKANEYEMVVPMGEDTELLAAQTVEEIARRHHFAPKAINQIKTALIEACINAAEHSHSPDNKIYQKFAVEEDRIVITISNRGLRLPDAKAREISPDEGRRGWGLKLMKSLMDEVKFEQVDDGTRISMTKYLKS